MEDEAKYTVDVTFGSVEIMGEYRPSGDGGLTWWGWSIHKDRDGNITKTTEAEPQSTIYFGAGPSEEPEKKWYQFWK